MKKFSLSSLAIIALLFSFSCKKEISPELEVTVVNIDNEPIRNVWVKTSVPGAEFGILNGEVIDSAATDMFGKAFFEYKNTVLIDIGLFAGRNDTVLIDSASVLLEVKRKTKNSDNITQRKLVFK